MKLNILSPSQCEPAIMDFTNFYSNEFKKFSGIWRIDGRKWSIS